MRGIMFDISKIIENSLIIDYRISESLDSQAFTLPPIEIFIQ
jgi:hypothetical protein